MKRGVVISLACCLCLTQPFDVLGYSHNRNQQLLGKFSTCTIETKKGAVMGYSQHIVIAAI
jgi:hypothetical protein